MKEELEEVQVLINASKMQNEVRMVICIVYD